MKCSDGIISKVNGGFTPPTEWRFTTIPGDTHTRAGRTENYKACRMPQFGMALYKFCIFDLHAITKLFPLPKLSMILTHV